jgi:hypothetical protein
MKRQKGTVLTLLVLLVVLLASASSTWAQSGAPTVVSYQGQVTVGGVPYDGTGYLKFAIVNAAGDTSYWSNDGTSSAGDEPTDAVALTVSNGLFSVLLGDTALANMGALPASAFDGADRTLRVWFSSDGSAFTQLSPDRRIAAVPYALQAEEANNADTVDGYHASDLLGGGGWSLTGNASTDPATNFLGTTDNQALEVRVNDARVLRLEPNATSPNRIGGYSGNWLTPGVYGGIIAGGGESGHLNRVTDSYGIVGGGHSNQAGDDDGTTVDAAGATVAGGWDNAASALGSVVGGGVGNQAADGGYSVIGGGSGNNTSGEYATIGGGHDNNTSGECATIAGGYGNIASEYATTIAGGEGNIATGVAAVAAGWHNTASGDSSTIAGGSTSTADGAYATVAGGELNLANGNYAFAAGRRAQAVLEGCFVWGDSTDADVACTLADQFVARATGGVSFDTGANPFQINGDFRVEPNAYSPNLIGGYSGNWVEDGTFGAVIAGGGQSGSLNRVVDHMGVVGGGQNNQAGSDDDEVGNNTFATVSGGVDNTASGTYGTIAGGTLNDASGDASAIGGGEGNTASGDHPTVAGGFYNTASGLSSIGGGRDNVVSHNFGTVGGGGWNQVTNTYGTVAGGGYNMASGYASAVGGGDHNTAGGQYATVPGGLEAQATHYGEMAYASGQFGTPGDAQASVYVLRRELTMAAGSWHDLFLDGSGISQRITIAAGRTVTFDILIAGRTEAGESAGYRIEGVIENVGGTTALVGTPTITVLGEDDAAWDVQVIASDADDALLPQVQGNGQTIRWVATANTAEVAW